MVRLELNLIHPTSGLKPELDNFEFTIEQSEEGYKNFTVIQCKVQIY